MKTRTMLAGLMMAVGMFAAETGAELFQKAVTQERAAGNLEEAIKLYQRVATEFAADRALAAKALLQEARCYEKLGQGKAVKLYEQIARDYSDQHEPVASANARLVALRTSDHAAPPKTMAERKIDYQPTGSRAIYSLVETDGQRVLYKDEATGALMMRDLATGSKRAILRPAGTISEAISGSRDLSRVVIYLKKPDGSSTMAVLKTDGAGYREIGAVENLCMPEWSWDNRYLLLCEQTPDGFQYLRFSFAGGESRRLFKAHTSVVHFSPDGRFIAYDEDGTLFTIPAEGGQPKLVATNSRAIDWTPDGRYLAIYESRSGASALSLIPMRDGQSAGNSVFVRYGPRGPARMLASGALEYEVSPSGGQYLNWVSRLSSDGHVQGWNTLPLFGGITSGHRISWSPDSTQIAYRTQNLAAGQNAYMLRVRNMNTGEDHQIYQSSADSVSCFWATREAMLYCGEGGSQDTAIFSIATGSGAVTRLGSAPGRNVPVMTSRDGRSIFMASWKAPDYGLAKWDIATQQLTTVDQDQHLPAPALSISPNERWIARRVSDNYEMRNLSGGGWTPIGPLGGLTAKAYTPDGNWIVYYEHADPHVTGKSSLFRVPVSGGQPERLGDFPDAIIGGLLYVSPDGKEIIATLSSMAAFKGAELWLLENFEPKAQTAKK
jgi:Tol biopolymer transport system component